jgi:mannose-6-phosphate isomerase-like protein (cupin superfamily)
MLAGLFAIACGCGCAQTRRQATPSVSPAAAEGRAEAPSRQSFRTNVLRAAQENDAYRRVIFTGARTQLVLMAIPPAGDIGFETHGTVEQLIFIASGQGKATVGAVERPVGAGDVLVLAPGTRHNVVNTGSEPLRIYTVYAPPNHIDGRVHRTKADAESDTADEAFGRAVR